MRAATLWKIATGTARLVIAPLEAACMKLFLADYYAGLALTLRRGEEYMPDMLLDHLLSVGYAKVDVVEMPGAGHRPRRHHGRLLARDGPPRPHRLLRRRDREHPQVRTGVATVVYVA